MKEKEDITIDLTDKEFLFLAKEAHDRDITLNQYVSMVLGDYLKKLKEENHI